MKILLELANIVMRKMKPENRLKLIELLGSRDFDELRNIFLSEAEHAGEEFEVFRRRVVENVRAVPVTIELSGPRSRVPTYSHETDACCDVVSSGPVSIPPGEVRQVHTGIRMKIPQGYEVQVRSRSGLSSRGVWVVNQPGTIDCDYRGELIVMLYNGTDEIYNVAPGDRIAQIAPKPVFKIAFTEGDVDSDTDRGEGGFGSTGR